MCTHIIHHNVGGCFPVFFKMKPAPPPPPTTGA